jgi:hypothetical protein
VAKAFTEKIKSGDPIGSLFFYILTKSEIYDIFILSKEAKIMDSILGILFNLFEGLDLAIILESIEGSLVEYDVSSVVDTFSSFFGGLLG